MKLALLLVSITLFLAGCVAAEYNGVPYAERRAVILSKNQSIILIEYNFWGKKLALRFANEHCSSMGKKAVLKGTSKQYSPYIVSSWRCVE